MGATSSSTDRRCLAAPTHVMDSAPDEKRGGKDCEVDQSDYSQPVAGVGGTHEGGSACVEHGWRTVHMRIFRIVCAVSSGTSSLCIKKKKKKKNLHSIGMEWVDKMNGLIQVCSRRIIGLRVAIQTSPILATA